MLLQPHYFTNFRLISSGVEVINQPRPPASASKKFVGRCVPCKLPIFKRFYLRLVYAFSEKMETALITRLTLPKLPSFSTHLNPVPHTFKL